MRMNLSRKFGAAHLPVASFGVRQRYHTPALLDETGLELPAFACYENNQHPDPGRSEQIAAHLRGQRVKTNAGPRESR
jgi:hypothetical protein